jgi:hypothetical protein
MLRLIIGSVLGGLAQFIVGFIFWGTPLAGLAYKVAGDAENANVQQALAANLTATGSGTYYVPWPDTAQGTTLHGQGPVAMIHFNTQGFPLVEGSSLIAGLILSIATIFLLGLALHLIAPRVKDFATRVKILVLVTVATVLYFTVGQPVFNYFMPWGYFVYLAISEVAGLVAGGLVVAWFLGKAAPAEEHPPGQG